MPRRPSSSCLRLFDRGSRSGLTLESLEDRRVLATWIEAGLNTPDPAGDDVFHVQAVETPVATQSSTSFVSTMVEDVTSGVAGGHTQFDPSLFQPMPLPVSDAGGTSEGPGQFVAHDLATGENRIHDRELPGTTVPADFVPGQAGPAANELPEPGVNPLDNFTALALIGEPSPHPWRMNVKTFQTFPSGRSFVCSGAMIDPLHVFTAGHCVHLTSEGGWADTVTVAPAFDNGALPYGTADATDLGSWTGWTQNQDFDHDLGTITLDRPVGALTGWFGYGYNDSPSFYTDDTFNNAGYPAEAPYSGQDMYYWYGDYDSTETSSGTWYGNEVRINREAWGGQSGSGAYVIDGNSRTVYTALSNGTSTYTDFVRITSSKFVDIRDTAIPGHTPGTYDLHALDVTLPTETVSAGSLLGGWSYLAHNYSSVAWNGRVNVDVYLSLDPMITAADMNIQDHYFDHSFGPRTSVRVNVGDLNIPSSVAPGSYYIGVILDVNDYDVSNNDSSGHDAAPLNVLADDHGNHTNSSTLIGSDSLTAGNLELNADTDWFSFYADTGANIRLETTLSSLFDSTLTLYASDGSTQLAYDDDGGAGRASLINHTISANGVYYAVVASFSGSYAGTYDLSLTHVDDHGDEALAATAIFATGLTSGRLEVGGDQDWFSFTADAGTEVTLETILGGYFTDSTLALYAPDGISQLAYDDDGGVGTASRITHTVGNTGTYFVKVAEYGVPNDPGRYDLSLILDDHSDTAAQATLIPAASLTGGDLEETADVDWFTFHAESGTFLTLEVVLGSLFDSTLTLFASDGTTQLAYDDDGGIGRGSRIEFNTPNYGQYYVKVASFGSNYSGNYELELTHADDHGDDTSAATYLPARSRPNGSLEIGGDRDWFYFFADAGVQVSFETVLNSLYDSTLTLYANDGVTQLAFDDDGGSGLASRIVFTPNVADVYFIMVTEYGIPNGPGTYELVFDYQDDHGNDIFTATQVALNSTTGGHVEVSGDADLFSFYATAGTSLRLETVLGTLLDSVLVLYDTQNQLAFDDDGGPGLASRIDYTITADGWYYAAVAGFGPSDIGTYDFVLTTQTALPGDFNGDSAYTCADINALVVEIAGGSNNPAFDLTGDALVNLADLHEWLAIAGAANLGAGRAYLPGDANLNGVVDGSDFGIWNANKFSAVPAWCSGDFNADGVIDGSDFGIWNTYKFQSADVARPLGQPSAELLSPRGRLDPNTAPRWEVAGTAAAELRAPLTAQLPDWAQRTRDTLVHREGPGQTTAIDSTRAAEELEWAVDTLFAKSWLGARRPMG